MHPDFFHRFRRRRERHRVDASFGRDDAVQRRVLACFALAVGDDRDRLAGDRYAAAAARLSVVAVARAERHPD